MRITEDQSNAHTYYNLVLALDRLGDYPAERQALIKGNELNANLAPAHNQQAFMNLGLILAGESRFPEAEQALDKAIRLDPGNKTALTARARVIQAVNLR